VPNPHPLALAYLRAFAAAHHARGHVVPTGMPSPAMQMHRARDAWQRAGCPLEVEAAHATPAEARAKLAALLADTPIEHEPPAPTFRLDHEPGLLGDLDLAAEGTIRIERMGDSSMWIRVEHEGGAVVINLHAKGGKLRQTVEVPRA